MNDTIKGTTSCGQSCICGSPVDAKFFKEKIYASFDESQFVEVYKVPISEDDNELIITVLKVEKLNGCLVVNALQNRLDALLSTADISAWEIDLTTQFFTVLSRNPAHLWLPEPNIPIHGKDIDLSLFPDSSKLISILSSCIEKKNGFDIVHQLKKEDGTLHWINSQGKYVLLDHSEKIIGTSRRLEEVKQSDSKKTNLSSKFNQIYEYSHEIFMELDLTGKIIDVSSSFEESIGFSKSQVVDFHLIDLACDRNQVKDFFKRIETENSVIDYEMYLFDIYNQRRYLLLNASMINNGDKSQTIIAAVRDHTSVKFFEKGFRLQKDISEQLKNVSDILLVWECFIDGLASWLNAENLIFFSIERGEKKLIPVLEHGQRDSLIDNVLQLSLPFEMCQRGISGIIPTPRNSEIPKKSTVLIISTTKGNGNYACFIASLQKQIEKSPEIISFIENIVTQIVDMLDNYQVKLELKTTEENLTTILNNVEDMIYVFSTSGKILFISNILEKRLGWEKDELKGKHVSFLFPPKYILEIYQMLEAIKPGENRFSIPLLSKKSTVIPVETIINQGIWNNDKALIGISRDVSFQINAHKSIVVRDQILEAVAYASEYFINNLGSTIDSAVVLEKIADAAGFDKILIGLREDNQFRIKSYWTKNKLEDIAAYFDKIIKTINHSVHKDKLETGQTLVINKSGYSIKNQTTDIIFPLKIRNDIPGFIAFEKFGASTSRALISALGTASSIISSALSRELLEQEQELLKDKLNNSQRLEVVGKMAGSIAHDFNNLLSPIIGFADLLIMDFPEGNRTRSVLEKIKTSAYTAKNLTAQLLAFSRKKMLRIETINPTHILEKMEDMLRQTLGQEIDFTMQIASNNTVIDADESQFEQIILNLVVNAKEAMKSGGILSIIVKTQYYDGNEFHETTRIIPGNYFQIEISDTGEGIPKEHLAHVFEPFFTTKPEGTGLGLSTVYGLVKQHNGYIIIQPKTIGTSFIILFPASRGISAKPITGESPKIRDISAVSTIVCDDQIEIVELINGILTRFGHKVQGTNNPRNALDIMVRPSHPDLLITDIVMPEMSGHELFHRIRDKHHDFKVLFMTGFSGDVIMDRISESSKVQYIQKPFGVSELMEKISLLFPESTA
ncbi:PAS domain S-box protein [Myxococcota bacterium]|nr:PAS domain S-box protein [Myxococcota bacterium]